jgi:hypothetical protein
MGSATKCGGFGEANPMKLIQLREQRRPKVIYHGTSVWHMASIVTENVMHEGAHWGRPNEPHGPRFTKNAKVARTFISYSAPDWLIGGVLAMSYDALDAKYEVVDYQDVDMEGNPWPQDEREVVVVTPQIKPVSNFLIGLWCSPKKIQEATTDEALKFAMYEYNFMGGKSKKKALAALENLANHPLLNK